MVGSRRVSTRTVRPTEGDATTEATATDWLSDATVLPPESTSRNEGCVANALPPAAAPAGFRLTTGACGAPVWTSKKGESTESEAGTPRAAEGLLGAAPTGLPLLEATGWAR
jgi:hypothetical protein